jgi:hypothetical protein
MVIPLHNNYIGVVFSKEANLKPTDYMKLLKENNIGFIGIIKIGTYPEISEEQAKEMVEEWFGGYYDYKDDCIAHTALESLQSLFESKEVDTKESKIVIIKTEK